MRYPLLTTFSVLPSYLAVAALAACHSGDPIGDRGGSGGGSSGIGGSSGTGGSPGTVHGDGCTPPAAYANLFVTLSGQTQSDSDAKVTAAWSLLFNPSGSGTIYYDGPGADESYVL